MLSIELIRKDPDYVRKALELRGEEDSLSHLLELQLSGNARIDALQAAILRVRLRHVDKWNRQRRENAALYSRLLEDSELVSGPANLRLPAPVPDGETANYHQYTMCVRDRDRLQQALAEKGISAGVYYPLALPHQPIFSHLGYREGDFPHAEEASREVLSLPVHHHLSRDDIERVVSEIVDFYRR